MENQPDTSHLGGHLNKTHLDEGVFNFLLRNFEIHTMLDIGCGPGGMIDLARSKGIEAFGVDGDPALFENPKPWVVQHDYTKGPLPLTYEAPTATYNLSNFDLGWSVEFVEHVEEQYVPNFIDTFKRCKYLVMTAAPPGWGGHHHVNCQLFPYWRKVMEDAGFKWDSHGTIRIRQHSTMTKPFMQRTGALFIRD